MSQNLFPDFSWLNNPEGQHQPQASSYHPTPGAGPGAVLGVDASSAVGGLGGAQPELDLSFPPVGELSGPGVFNPSYASNVFASFANHGGFFTNSYNASMFPASAWSQPPVSTSSSYSTLNGAVTSTPAPAARHAHTQAPSTSPTIDPSITLASGSSSPTGPGIYIETPQPGHVQQYPSTTSQYQPYSHISPSALSISPSASVELPFQTQQRLSPQTQHPPTQQDTRTSQPSYALQTSAPIPPAQFYGTTSTPPATTPPSSALPQAQPIIPAPPTAQVKTEYSPTDAQRENLRAAVAPCLLERAFTGARAVQTLVAAVTEFGIVHVDIPMRLDILNKTLQNAGNNYYRAWMENVSAMDITREWLKATATSSAEGQVLETTMPLLTLLDRLPFTGPALKAAKVGKLVRRLSETATNAAVKDMASNLERKWREKFVAHKDEPMDVDKDRKGLKRKSDRERDASSSKTAPPTKKTVVAATPSKALGTHIKESGTKATSGTGTGASGVKESKPDTSFFSKPKPKLPTFKKAPAAPVKKENTASIAQPSAFNPFQEALKDMERSRRQSPTAAPIPAPAPPAATSASPVGNLSKSGKPKKRVTWAPDGQLELIKLIERAEYDDDPAAGTHAVHSLRDLDKGEGAALHHAADAFEELIDWIEPSSLEIPADIPARTRGEASEEKIIQEQREGAALHAMYLTLSQVPESPAEPVHILPLDQVDAQARIMLAGGEITSHLSAMREQHGVSIGGAGLQPSVTELVGQLGAASQPQTQPVADALALAGIDVKLLSDPNVTSHLPQQQLQELLQMLGGPQSAGMAPTNQPLDTWTPTPPNSTNGYLLASSTPPQVNSQQEDAGRWDSPGSRGHGWRGRGRGRGRGGGKSRVPCSFFLQGRCKYGDQCDFSHEMSYG